MKALAPLTPAIMVSEGYPSGLVPEHMGQDDAYAKQPLIEPSLNASPRYALDGGEKMKSHVTR